MLIGENSWRLGPVLLRPIRFRCAGVWISIGLACVCIYCTVAYMYQRRAQEFCSGGGVQQIQLRTEDRENGDLGAVAP